ncbi:MAG TPA: sigma-70 family RNA polymerase sigma factor [Pyrinomonadaceae bacterium]|nr:sigma-70 family RNA polymerase sigma factor [Pyrinomonadaceae bacterium]
MEQTSEINTFVGHLFRHHAGKMAAVLSRKFGVSNIDLIEDAIQDAMITAMKRWPFAGTPDNPTAWLTQVAKNSVIDKLRRDQRNLAIEDREFVYEDTPITQFEGEIGDDQLRLIFACCHPTISPDSQVALTLKIVGGFSVGEIARAFLSNEASVAKLITRAKTSLKTGGVPFEIPSGNEIAERLSAVHKVLYLMFNEGYSPTAGSEPIRSDLCSEAMRLAENMSHHRSTSTPQTHALAALFCFHAARFPARVNSDGEMLLLGDQDRSAWDRELIGRGLDHMMASARGNEISDYHIEAEVASIHAAAASIEATDWPRIVECYDLLQKRKYSPIAELNRVIAIGHIEGPEAALSRFDRLAIDGRLDKYCLYHGARAHFLAAASKFEEAIAAYDKALSLSYNETTRRVISNRIADLKEAMNEYTI